MNEWIDQRNGNDSVQLKNQIKEMNSLKSLENKHELELEIITIKQT